MTLSTAAASTVAGARHALTQMFRDHEIDTPELDARVLVAHALGLDHAGLAAQAARTLQTAEIAAIESVAARRIAHEPVARIIGVKEFWGLDFRLNAATLVPRPETETVVEAALNAIAARRADQLRIADLGTGSGALLLALLSELPAARGIGTDRSLAALAAARANAAALGLAARTRFTACDYADALAGPFDLVVANPPYVVRDEIASLAPEVRDFDPRLALDGGADGLAAYRAIAAQARRLLVPNGQLVLEIGIGQREAVARILADAGLAIGETRQDLGGVPRVVTAGVSRTASGHTSPTSLTRKKALGLRAETD